MFDHSLSIVVPVYNSAGGLADLVAKLGEVLPTLCRKYELILVNDGSRDQSWREIERLARERSFVRGVNLMRNFGQHNALLCGVRQARHEVVVTMDDDLQHPPEEIAKLLTALDQGADVVYGTHDKDRQTLWRALASKTVRFLMVRAVGAENADKITAFRAFRTRLRDAFERFESPMVSLDVLLTWGARRFAGVKVRHEPRRRGASGYNFMKLARLAMTMITGFSVKPLKLATLLGLSFSLFGGLVLAYVLTRWLISGSVVQGFAFLASIVAIFSGAQLVCLGIIGEYLAHMFQMNLNQPAYVIDARVGADDGEEDGA